MFGVDQNDTIMEKEKLFLSAFERKEKGLYREDDKKLRCQYCITFFSRNADAIRHEKNFHNIQITHKCYHCGQSFLLREELLKHRQSHIFHGINFKIKKEAFGGTARTYNLVTNSLSLKSCFCDEVAEEIKKICESETIEKKRLFFSLGVHCLFLKFDVDGEITSKAPVVFASVRREMNITQTGVYFQKIFYEAFKHIEHRMEDFTQNGSGWTLAEVSSMDLNFLEVKSLRGGCSLSSKIPHKVGVLNIKNEDHSCLLYCILAQLHYDELSAEERKIPKTYHQWLDDFDIGGIRFPIKLEDIPKLENQNTHLRFRVNVYIEIDDIVVRNRYYTLSEDEHQENITIVNVLLTETSQEEGLFHFSLIEDANRFFAKRYTRKSDHQNNRQCYSRDYTCIRCTARYSSKEKLDRHLTVCRDASTPCTSVLRFKKPGEKLTFEKPWLQYPHLFCGYVDFESVLIKKDEQTTKCFKCISERQSNCEHSFTNQLHMHKAINFCLIVVNRDGEVVFEKVYTGEDASEQFLVTLSELEKDIRTACLSNENMVFTAVDEINFDLEGNCHICNRVIIDRRDKVRDHCHQTGRFLGAAHNKCNMNRKEKAVLKIFAHNFSGYDSHLIIEKLDHVSVRDVSVIPKSGEKFMMIEINKTFTLCDSMMFLAGSLDTLSKGLASDHQYPILRQSSLFQALKNENDMDLLFKKWKYPYEYAQTLEDLEKTHSIPPMNCFYNSLTNETISKDDHDTTCQIFNYFNCQNLKEYMEFYCMLDVYLLAEIFTEFRNETISNFEIDPCNFISLPGMGLQCFLKKSKVELDYIYNGKYDFFFIFYFLF
jgi:hypothetical protein